MGSAVNEGAGGWRVGFVHARTGWRPLGPGDPGPRAQLSLVPGRSMGPELGEGLRLGLESLPRRARSGRPNWAGRLWALGSPAVMGAAATTSTVVGAWGTGDVEPDCQRLGILEQQNMDSDLTKRRLSQGGWIENPCWAATPTTTAGTRQPTAPAPERTRCRRVLDGPTGLPLQWPRRRCRSGFARPTRCIHPRAVGSGSPYSPR